MATSDQHHFTYSADPCIKHLCQNFIFFDSCCIILIDYLTMTEAKMELGFLFIFQKTYQANYQPIISYYVILREFLFRSEKKKKKKKWLLFGSHYLLSYYQMSVPFIKLKKVLIFIANFMKNICCQETWSQNLQ